AQDAGGEARGKAGEEGPPRSYFALTARGSEAATIAARRRLNGTVAARQLLGPAGIAPARLGRDAFNRPTLSVARNLLGKFIVHRHGRHLRSAMITEIEAYKGPQDLASHARGGRRTRRVEPLYGEGG